METGIARRWEGWENGLRWPSARSLYNLADACWPDRTAGAAERVARAVRHAGPGAARLVWLSLVWLDAAPLLRGQGARFWRLPADARRAAAARWQASRLGWRRRTWALVEEAIRTREADAAQSSSGA